MKKLLITTTFLISSLTMAKIQNPIPEDSNILMEFSIAKMGSLDPKSIKVLDWNLDKGHIEKAKKDNLNFDKDFQLLASEKDLLILQEMLLDEKMSDTFLAQKDLGFETATSYLSPPSFTRTGLATASIANAINSKFIKTQVLEKYTKTPKLTLVTEYTLEGTSNLLTVANVNTLDEATDEHFNVELDRIYQTLKVTNGPLILAGDFNTWSPNRQAYLQAMVSKLNLKEINFKKDNRILVKNLPVDHFYTSKDLIVKKSLVRNDFEGIKFNPIEIELEYSGF